MKIAGRRFKPALWSFVLTLVGISIFCTLGFWQLERAEYKESVRLKFAERLAAGYQRLDLDGGFDDIAYRRFRLDGRFDDRHHFLLDNQVHEGEAGYHVLTPFELNNSDAILLVNRGWVAWGVARDKLPEILAPVSDDEIRGIAHVPQLSGFRLGEIELKQTWPQLIPYLDIEALREQYSPRLLPMVLWMSPEQPGHYLRDWRPVWMPPEKSRAYAVQWFSFAAIALLLFLVLNLRKPE